MFWAAVVLFGQTVTSNLLEYLQQAFFGNISIGANEFKKPPASNINDNNNNNKFIIIIIININIIIIKINLPLHNHLRQTRDHTFHHRGQPC